MALPRRALACGLWLLAALPATAAPPDFAAVRAAHPASESRLYDRHGALLHEQRTDLTRRRGQWVPLDAISPRLIASVIALEDHRFHAHRGVDWFALAAAARDTLLGRPRGASTIPMQLVARLDPTLHDGQRRDPRRKWRQIAAARELDAAWGKARVLEAYLNLASFRGELEGVDSAARALFDKAPAALDVHEALLLALLLRQPNAAPTTLARRACRVAPGRIEHFDCAHFEGLAGRALGTPPHLRPAATLAPHVARRLLAKGEERVTSTLDAEIQRLALASLQQQLRELAPRNVRDGAVLVVDNASGEVLAYAGNGGKLSSARHVDGVRALRQAGSTLKPFLYALALESRLLTAASLLEDSPVNLATPTGLYVPRNYDHGFRGLVSLRDSLAGSLNVPAVRTLMLLGPERLLARLRSLGFADITQDGDHYGYALALGSPEVTLWQLVNAYRALALGGAPPTPLRLREPAPASAGPTGRVASSDGTAAAFVVADILADRTARSRSFGVDNPLDLPFPAAVKTGTSKEMRDNWCVGFTDRYTVGVWVGNFDGAPMWDVSGLSGAAPVWAGLMRQLHARAPAATPAPPAGVERRQVRYATGSARMEWFLAGTAGVTSAQRGPAPAAPRITYPAADSLLVVDPDIPRAAQRVFWVMQPSRPDLHWRLDGERVSNDGWFPRPGPHRLTLVDGDGQTLDSVRFDVRGGPLAIVSATGEGPGIGVGDETR
jgi:penicillin-binding protein 1C